MQLPAGAELLFKAALNVTFKLQGTFWLMISRFSELRTSRISRYDAAKGKGMSMGSLPRHHNKHQHSAEWLFPPVFSLCHPANIIYKVFLRCSFLLFLPTMTRVTTRRTERLLRSEHPAGLGFGSEETLQENKSSVFFSRLLFGEMEPLNLIKPP